MRTGALSPADMAGNLAASMDVLNAAALSEEEETRLILESRSDPQAFAPLYEKYYDRVYRYLFRECGDPATAEDLTSETFFKAMRGIRGYHRGHAPVQAWLFRIAHNTFISHWRKEKVRRLFRLERRHESPPAEAISVNPDRAIDTARAGEMVERLLRSLKARDQAIITLRYYEEMSLRDVAFITGMSEGNVRTRLHRALGRLKSLIENEAPEIVALIQGGMPTHGGERERGE